MIKGRHGKNWFFNNIGKFIINCKNAQIIFIADFYHANQLFLNQNLNNQKYKLFKK
jgi:hypothetical protein